MTPINSHLLIPSHHHCCSPPLGSLHHVGPCSLSCTWCQRTTSQLRSFSSLVALRIKSTHLATVPKAPLTPLPTPIAFQPHCFLSPQTCQAHCTVGFCTHCPSYPNTLPRIMTEMVTLNFTLQFKYYPLKFSWLPCLSTPQLAPFLSSIALCYFLCSSLSESHLISVFAF